MTADQIIRAELDADPLGRGYAGMSDIEVRNDLNAPTRESWVPVSASDILEAINPAALEALSAEHREDLDSVLSMGTVIHLYPGSRGRVLLTTAFAGAVPTLNALLLLGKRMISRAYELNCGVNEQIVAAARALP